MRQKIQGTHAQDVRIPQCRIRAKTGKKIYIPRKNKKIEQIQPRKSIEHPIKESIATKTNEPNIRYQRKEKHDITTSHSRNHEREIDKDKKSTQQEIDITTGGSSNALLIMPCHIQHHTIDR